MLSSRLSACKLAPVREQSQPHPQSPDWNLAGDLTLKHCIRPGRMEGSVMPFLHRPLHQQTPSLSRNHHLLNSITHHSCAQRPIKPPQSQLPALV